MGFTWKHYVSKRKVLVERRDIIDCRCRYLIKMRQAREKLKDMFFIDETWVDSNLTYRKCWQGPGIRGVMDTVSGSNRHIVVHIGSKGVSYLEPSCHTKQIARVGTTTGK
jgi:hypothetical protein